MRIIIRSTLQQKQSLLQKGFANVTVEWVDKNESFENNADAFFDLTFNDENIDANNFSDNVVVFANAVNCTCAEIGKKNYVRINAWPGFLNYGLTELACADEETKIKAAEVLNALNWKFVWCADDYGFISARIIAMIINEAYYALEEKVSTKEQIDMAMKLGTNYPFGPFEWAEKIGIEKIDLLLKKLSEANSRYTISALLEKEI